MIIALEALFEGGIESIPVNTEFDFSEESYDGVYPFKTPVRVFGEIKNTAGIVTIEASAVYTMNVNCDRCDENVDLDFETKISHGLVNYLNDDENDDYILLEDMKLDLRELTLEDIYLALPSKLLCREDCKGLCVKCGANLNVAPCECEKDIDPRWAALFENGD